MHCRVTRTRSPHCVRAFAGRRRGSSVAFLLESIRHASNRVVFTSLPGDWARSAIRSPNGWRRKKTKLVLVVRDDLPSRVEWSAWIGAHAVDDPKSVQLQRLLALEANGAQLLTCRADVSNYGEMEAVFAQAVSRFGSVNGVIHCAGRLRDALVAIDDASVATRRTQFLPKVQGVLVLEALLANYDVEFCVLMSSLAAVLGATRILRLCRSQCLDGCVCLRSPRARRRTVGQHWLGRLAIG